MGIYKIIGLTLAWLFRSFLVATAFTYLYFGDTVGFILFLLTFIITLIPIMVEQLYRIHFHWFLQLSISYLMAVHMLGFLGAYLWIPFYDNFAHIMGSMLVALLGFSIVYSLNYSGRIKLSLPLMGVFTFIWTMAIGALWEIIEFIWDNIVVFSHEYGFSQNSLFDTMTDISLDAVSGIVIAMLCIFLVRHASKKALEGIFSPFVRMIQHKKPRG